MEQESLQVQNQVQGMTEGTQTAGSSSPTETMIPQSRVNDILRERLAQQKEKLTSEYSSQPNMSTQSVDLEKVRSLAAEEAKKHFDSLIQAKETEMRQVEGQRVANEFISKLEAGKTSYDDFDDVVGSLPFAQIPDIIQLANRAENTSDVMYEIGKNPAKMAHLSYLMGIDPTGSLALREMNNLSNSIKTNKAAQNVKTPNEPLSQLKSSPIGADNGSMTVSDFRKIFT